MRGAKKETKDDAQIGFGALAGNEIVEALKKLQVETLSPIEALNTLYTLAKKASEL